MDVEIGRHGLLDCPRNLRKFDRAVALVAVPDDPTGGDVQGYDVRSCPIKISRNFLLNPNAPG